MGLNFLSRNEIGTCGLAIIETTDDRSHCAVPCKVRGMKKPMKKAAARKAEVKKPVAKKAAAKRAAPKQRTPKKSSATYTPAPLQTIGEVPFRYPPQ